MRLIRATVTVGLLFVLAGTCAAHEFWIEPETHRPQTDKVFRISLHHGERFAGEVVPRDEQKIKRFAVVAGAENGGAGETPVVGRSGGPFSLARPAATGPNIIVYESNGQTNELPAEKFENYLREEGLAFIVQQRAERGESRQPGRETYTRCAKALVFAAARAGFDAGSRNTVTGGTGHGSPAPALDLEQRDRPVGLPLEIIATRIPSCDFTAATSEPQPLLLEVRYENQPLPNATLVAVNSAEPTRLLRVTTDAQGQASITLPRPGRWLVTTIHMVREENHAVSDNRQAAAPSDWHSFWASLTLEIGAAGDQRAVTRIDRSSSK